MAEPENDTVPMSTPRSTSSTTYVAGFSPPDVRCMDPTTETSAAAPPPTPLKMATSCGIAVIFTKRLTGIPIAAPTTMAITMGAMLCRLGWKKVATMATAMPNMAMKLPDRARLGFDRPLSARMKVTAAKR